MMEAINDITKEHLDGLRRQFKCHYDEIFMGLYGVDSIHHKTVKILLWSIEVNSFLPSKEKFIEYEETFLKEKIM